MYRGVVACSLRGDLPYRKIVPPLAGEARRQPRGAEITPGTAWFAQKFNTSLNRRMLC